MVGQLTQTDTCQTETAIHVWAECAFCWGQPRDNAATSHTVYFNNISASTLIKLTSRYEDEFKIKAPTSSLSVMLRLQVGDILGF